jgi:hypothetical protein
MIGVRTQRQAASQAKKRSSAAGERLSTSIHINMPHSEKIRLKLSSLGLNEQIRSVPVDRP